MKVSYVLMFNRTDGEISKLSIRNGDPEIPDAVVKTSLNMIKNANILSEKFGELVSAYGFQRIGIETRILNVK